LRRKKGTQLGSIKGIQLEKKTESGAQLGGKKAKFGKGKKDIVEKRKENSWEGKQGTQLEKDSLAHSCEEKDSLRRKRQFGKEKGQLGRESKQLRGKRQSLGRKKGSWEGKANSWEGKATQRKEENKGGEGSEAAV
jgi:hypothetical protein